MSSVVESSTPAIPGSRRHYPGIDPEAETVEVLALVNGRYEQVERGHHAETAASRLLPGFEVSLGYLFRGA
jgi:hypothetical protein